MDDGMREYLRSLQASIETQEATIESLRGKNKRLEEKLLTAESYSEELRLQVQNLSQEVEALKSELLAQKEKIVKSDEDQTSAMMTVGNVAEEITKAASEVVHEQFLKSMVYEKTSGLYYDQNSGYYYDANKKMYYDGNSGYYLRYNFEANEYEKVNSDNVVINENSASPVTSTTVSSDTETLPSDSEISQENEKMDHEHLNKNGEKREGAAVSDERLSEGELSSDSPPPAKLSRKSNAAKLEKKNIRKEQKRLKKELKIPCIRMVVHTTTESSAIHIGTLFIITCTGGSIGREGNHDVLLNDIACSKNHCKIEFDEDQDKYFLTDIGSQNGTFIDGHRLSSAKKESPPKEIGHGTIIKIGSTQLICHVHPGKETCQKCEPGVIIASQPKLNVSNVPSKEEREEKRKQEIKQMRRKYGISGKDNDTSSITELSKSGHYKDRADDRRKTKGSDHDSFKTEVASVELPITSQNKGFKLLSSMGWKEGDGIGKDNNKGRLEPINAIQRAERSGLGSNSGTGNVLNLNISNSKQKKKIDILRKTQERFDKFSD